MTNELTFNDLPQVVAELRDEVIGMRQMLTSLQKDNGQRKELSLIHISEPTRH